MLSSLPHWASCEVFPGKQPASLVSMLGTITSPGQPGGLRGEERDCSGTLGQMGCWSSERTPETPRLLTSSLPQCRTHSQGLRSLAGHSKPPLSPTSPAMDPLLWPSHGSPTVPHPHFWPEFDRGNSSWQTPKAEMREIHKPDVLVWREGSGGWAP